MILYYIYNIIFQLVLKVNALDFQTFGVIEEGKQYVVNIESMNCSCSVWDQDQIPCVHACAVIRRKNLSPYLFVAEFYHTHKLQATYAGKVMPIGDKEQWLPGKDDEDVKIAPPSQKRAAGRPKKERFQSVGEFKKKGSPNRCSRCGKAGHNKKACMNPCIVTVKHDMKQADSNKE